MFFTSLAVQLTRNIPQIQQFITDALLEQENIADQSFRDQWRQLIVLPLSRLDSRSPYVLVVDALDECDNEDNIRMILQLLSEARTLKTIRLRIFLTSRPEIPIRHGFCQIPDSEHQEFVLHNISPAIVDHDISTFLKYNLKLIAAERSLEAGWPGDLVIIKLVQKASGLFIWAATASRFIREGKKLAKSRLVTVLQGHELVRGPEKSLNDMYLTVLKNSLPQDCTKQEQEDLYNMLRKVLGSIVVLLSPLSADALATLLHIPEQDINETLEDLHSILNIPKDGTRFLRLHHPSFRDFLLNKERCDDLNFQVNEKQAHQALADYCIRLMSMSLRQDVCGLKAPGVLVTDVAGSRVSQYLPLSVQYACLYWIQHLQRSEAQLQDNDQVYQFLQVHLLHWLEALGWMAKTSEGILAILSLEGFIPVGSSLTL